MSSVYNATINRLSRTLYRLMILLGIGSECCDKGGGTIDNDQNRTSFTSDFDINTVDASNVPKIV